MRYQFVLMVCWLWRVASVETEKTETSTDSSPTTTDIICHGAQMLDRVMFNCGYPIEQYYCYHKGDGGFNCTISLRDFSTQLGYCNNLTTSASDCESTCNNDKDIKPSESTMPCTHIYNVTDTSQTETSQLNSDKCSSSSNIIIVALGVLLGLLVVLLATVTIGLLWTCWLLKRRGAFKFNTDSELRKRSSIDRQLVNPTYEGDNLLHLQPQQSTPAYETIPPHPKDEARLEFIEQGESGYSVLSRELRANPETTTTTHMEMILEDSREESYSKLELKEESGSTKKTSDEEYSRLEIVNIGSTVPKDTRLDNDSITTADSNCDNNEQTEHERKERVMDNNNGDALQLESGNVEKGQQEEVKEEVTEREELFKRHKLY